MSDQNQNPDDPIFGDTPDNELSGQTPPPATPPAAPPPPPGAMPPAPPAPAAGGADIGSAFSWAIAKLQESIGIWLGLAAAVVVINVVGSVVTRALVSGATSAGTSTGVAATGLGISLVVGLLFGVLAALASIGVYRAALRRTQGVAPSFEQMTTTENLMAYVVVAIVYALATVLGLALCILPGVIVVVLFLFAPYFALDKGQGVGEAFRNSYALVTGNLGKVVLAILVNIVASILGSSNILFGLLVLVTLPFSALFTAYVYRSLQGEQVAP